MDHRELILHCLKGHVPLGASSPSSRLSTPPTHTDTHRITHHPGSQGGPVEQGDSREEGRSAVNQDRHFMHGYRHSVRWHLPTTASVCRVGGRATARDARPDGILDRRLVATNEIGGPRDGPPKRRINYATGTIRLRAGVVENEHGGGDIIAVDVDARSTPHARDAQGVAQTDGDHGVADLDGSGGFVVPAIDAKDLGWVKRSISEQGTQSGWTQSFATLPLSPRTPPSIPAPCQPIPGQDPWVERREIRENWGQSRNRALAPHGGGVREKNSRR